MVAERDDAGKVGEVPLHLLRQDVTLVRHRLQGALLTQLEIQNQKLAV
jgi:hypothetical protein